jgi:hypothetical protein
MNFDVLLQWLLLRPFIVSLVACLLLALAALVGWYAGRRYAKRTRNEEADRVPTVGEGAADGPDRIAAREELIRRHPHVVPREWDGGQPRPNWNRFSG